MSAVDDLKSYGQVADVHADGIRRLTPAFQMLYDSMSDASRLCPSAGAGRQSVHTAQIPVACGIARDVVR